MGLKLIFNLSRIACEVCGLDSVDRVIWVLPVLAFMDVVSTFLVERLGYNLARYETGFFARVFVNSWWIYAYAVVYVLGIAAISYALWDIKNKRLEPSRLVDKAIFLFLVVVAYLVYVRITVAFVVNVLLPYLVNGDISLTLVTWLIYLSTAFSLGFYVWHDVLAWVRTDGSNTG